MYLIHIFRRETADYDEVQSFVIRAKSPRDARKFAASQCGDEGKEVWLSPKFSVCRLLKTDGEEGIICKDAKYG